MKDIVLLAHNLRSTHNVGSLLRTAEGLGVEEVFLTGYSPYPQTIDDKRLPHIVAKLSKQISKTALGAEKSQKWKHQQDISSVISSLKNKNYQIIALEQTNSSIPISSLSLHTKVALVVGREVEGIEPEVIEMCDLVVEIPMRGQKESFNVAQATAMGLYHLFYLG